MKKNIIGATTTIALIVFVLSCSLLDYVKGTQIPLVACLISGGYVGLVLLANRPRR